VADSATNIPAVKGSVPSVPRDTEEGRAFLQARLMLINKIGFFITLFFAVVGLAARLALPFNDTSWPLFGVVMQLSGLVVHGSAWLITRRGRYSAGVLALIDSAAASFAALGVIMMCASIPPYGRPDLLAVYNVSQILGLRVAVVPSTVKRSVFITAIAQIMLATFSYLYYRAHSDFHPEFGPVTFAVMSLVFSLAMMAVAVVATWTIYGLRKKIRETAQLGQYTLEERIGQGGMGIVYRAHHAMLRRPTAVKLLLPDQAGEHNIRRFEREVQMTSMLTHPNTIAIYDFGRTPDGIFYYAMEYLEGIDLQNLIEHDGPQPEGRVIHVLEQVCGALGEAHGIGLIHRDIKPANIFLCERGGVADVAKILDFGLVKSMEQSADPGITAVGQIAGTPLYMPPEAMVAPERTDARSDLYGLAAVGYFLLTGTPVFEGRTVVEVGAQHLHSPPVRPSQRLGRPVSPDLEDALLACLEKDPAQRPADARTFAARLARCRSASAWSSDEGRAWWQQRGRDIHARAYRLDRSTSGPRELTIDVAARAGR
jgi:hypothetical protein